MSRTIHVGENLAMDIDEELWTCSACSRELGPAQENFKHGLLVYERDPKEIHPPLIEGLYTFSPNAAWIRILEFYCPGCGAQIETEYLPPGHPITNTTEIDVASLKARLAKGELAIEDGRLKVVDA